jgi:predicted enzyme related to lactoylglutathione lyase
MGHHPARVGSGVVSFVVRAERALPRRPLATVDTGVPGALYTAISPLQGGSDLVTLFVAVDDVHSAVNRARELGGRVIQEPQHVPGVAFALIADP